MGALKVVVHRGLDEIGGSIIEVEAKNTRILLDAGEELDGYSNPVDFQKLLDSRQYDALLISHYHADHVGLAAKATGLPPVYMGETAYAIYKATCERAGVEAPFSPAGWLSNGCGFRIGDIEVTPVLADHSAIDAYSILLECDSESVLYTGDFRGNGRKSFERYLKSLPTKVDVLVCEGTTLGRGELRNKTERQVDKEMHEAFSRYPNQAFVLTATTNMDRMVSIYRAAKRSGRMLLQDVYQAKLTSLCAHHSIPNPSTFDDVYAFTSHPLDKDRRAEARGLFGDHFISRNAYFGQKFVMCIRTSDAMAANLRKLDELCSLAGSVLVYSLWNGYKAKPEVAEFLAEAIKLGIDVVTIHASGHADPNDIRAVVDRVNPRKIVPVHTEFGEWFESEYGDSIDVCADKEVEAV